MVSDLSIFAVPRVTTITDLSALGITVKHRPDRPDFVWDDATRTVWKSAGWIILRDNGTVSASYEDHLTEKELLVFYGGIERAYTGGARLARFERWKRRRPSSKRKIGYWIHYVYVRIREGEAFDQIEVAMSAPPHRERIAASGEAIERELSA